MKKITLLAGLTAMGLLVVALGISMPAPAGEPNAGNPSANEALAEAALAKTAAPRNIILLIGDGMGPEHVRAAGMFLHGEEGSLCFEKMPHHSEITTHDSRGETTDSAASATAFACGVKVENGVISRRIPGDGSDLVTILDVLRDRGRSTGLVTTTEMTHATPAAFGAKVNNRGESDGIAACYLDMTRPNVLLGGGGKVDPAKAAEAGYTVVADRASLEAVDPDSVERLAGLFGEGHLPYEHDGVGHLPHLSEMVKTALAVLDNDPDGLFLMVEGGRIDHAGHANDIDRNVRETVEFANAVEVVMDWAKDRDDTLILVTADHETGGLAVQQNRGKGQIPEHTWSSGGHTNVPVDLFGWGPNSDLVEMAKDNTDVHRIMMAGIAEPAMEQAAAGEPAAAP